MAQLVPVWGHQGRLRDWFHTTSGARFLNAQTSWFKIAAPKGFAVLTTTGRRTGRLRHSNVRLITRGRQAFLVSIAGTQNSWIKNLQDNPEVELRLGRQNHMGRARPPCDDHERQRARDTYCQTVNWFDFVSSLVNQRGVPSRRRIVEMHSRWFDQGVVLVIELRPASSGLMGQRA